jgi:polysaccharide deacetylase 2 family uncharacterized protein YibQ
VDNKCSHVPTALSKQQLQGRLKQQAQRVIELQRLHKALDKKSDAHSTKNGHYSRYVAKKYDPQKNSLRMTQLPPQVKLDFAPQRQSKTRLQRTAGKRSHRIVDVCEFML